MARLGSAGVGVLEGIDVGKLLRSDNASELWQRLDAMSSDVGQPGAAISWIAARDIKPSGDRSCDIRWDGVGDLEPGRAE